MRLYQSVEEIEGLVHSFEHCTLPSEEWTHAAHLSVALWYLTHHPITDATNHIRNGIQAYNKSRGLLSTPTGGYHETITLFYIRVIDSYLHNTDRATSLPELADGLIRDYGHKRLLSQCYSRALLLTPEARREWVEPDLASL